MSVDEAGASVCRLDRPVPGRSRNSRCLWALPSPAKRQHAYRMSMARLLDSPLLALPLRNANFGLYSAGSGISLIGMWMQRIAIGWLTWQLTESGFWLGVIAFADFFPVILVGPIAGA